MNFKKLTGFGFLIILLIAGSIFLLQKKTEPEPFLADSPEGCTVIIVGKDASTDGSVMTTHTCDCGICDWTWGHVPAADHSPGSMRKIWHIHQYKTWPEAQKWDIYQKYGATDIEIPQVAHTYGYHHGEFGYMNDKQVAIGESTIGSQERLVNPTPTPAFDITMLTLIALERASTAREAIKIMGSLSEKHGYGYYDDGEMLAVADPNEVWIFEIHPVGPLWTPKSGKPGAVWCAQRVPDDHVSVCPNSSRIGEIDLDNPDYFMASPNVISLAVDNGFYDPSSGEPFNWKKAYSPTDGSAKSTTGWIARTWRLLDLVATSQKIDPDTPEMELPFSVKPDNKLSVEDVIRLTRDKYEDSHFDLRGTLQAGPFSNPNYRTRPFEFEGKRYLTKRFISDNRAEYVTVTQSRGWLPGHIGGIIWLAWGAQDTSCYVPLYMGMDDLPESFKIGDHWKFDRESARWAFDYVDFHTQVAYSYAIQDVRKAQEKWEKKAMDMIPDIDKKAITLSEKDPMEAKAFLTEFCSDFAGKVIQAWWTLGDDLLVKYNHLWHYDVENRTKEQLTYPDWWIRAIIEHDGLKSQEEIKK